MDDVSGEAHAVATGVFPAFGGAALARLGRCRFRAMGLGRPGLGVPVFIPLVKADKKIEYSG